jgi:transcriptional regulator with XRE-family HTH domain
MQEAYNIMEIRKLYGLNQTDFAKKVKMSRELVSKLENGKVELKKPTVRKIRQFLENHPVVNISQDVNFIGRPAEVERRRGGGQPYYLSRRDHKNEDSVYLVPMVGVKAQAGFVRGYEHVDYLDGLEKYSLPPGVNPTGAMWSYFEVDGESMEPTFYAGDILLASLLPHEDWHDLKNFCVYIVLTDTQLLVKRVYRKSEHVWTLLSDNREGYGAVELNVEQVRQVWTFRRHIRSRVPEWRG